MVIGTDSERRTNTFVALDGVGRRLGGCTLRADTDGYLRRLNRPGRFESVTFALEDCRHFDHRLESDLLHAPQLVPPR